MKRQKRFCCHFLQKFWNKQSAGETFLSFLFSPAPKAHQFFFVNQPKKNKNRKKLKRHADKVRPLHFLRRRRRADVAVKSLGSIAIVLRRCLAISAHPVQSAATRPKLKRRQDGARSI
jgi:uncharacterized protein YpiB (UPF0302 family)